MNLTEMKALMKGMPVPELKATIKKVYPQEVKTYQDKSWTQQNVILNDESGSMMAQFMDTESMDTSLEGQSIEMKSQATKHGIKGVTINKYNSKSGEEVTNLKVSKMALVQIGGALEPIPETIVRAAQAAKPIIPVNKPPVTKFDSAPAKVAFDKAEKRKTKAMCLSYSKDLCLGAKIKVEDITKQTDDFVDYIFRDDDDLRNIARMAEKVSEEDLGTAIEPEYTGEIDF